MNSKAKCPVWHIFGIVNWDRYENLIWGKNI